MFYFTGLYEHTLDKKNRVTIPSSFRQELANGVVIAKGFDACLEGYPAERWEEKAQKALAKDPKHPLVRKYQRHIFSTASQAIPDGQGRVLLPAPLREYANIKEEVVFVGIGDHFEIWNKDDWKEYEAEMTSQAPPDWTELP